MNSPIADKIFQANADKQSALASTAHLRNFTQPQNLGDVSTDGQGIPGPIPKDVDYTPVDPNPDRTDGKPFARVDDTFMSKLYDIESKNGTMSDRKGSQYKGIAQLGNDIRKPLLKKYGYTEAQYNASKDIQKKLAIEHISNIKTRLKRNGFEVTPINVWTAHNQGFEGLNQIIHNKVSPGVLSNIRNQAGMNSRSTAQDYLKHYGSKFQ